MNLKRTTKKKNKESLELSLLNVIIYSLFNTYYDFDFKEFFVNVLNVKIIIFLNLVLSTKMLEKMCAGYSVYKTIKKKKKTYNLKIITVYSVITAPSVLMHT